MDGGIALRLLSSALGPPPLSSAFGIATVLVYRAIIPLVIALSALAHGGESDYFSSLLSSVDKSRAGMQPITSASLVDTNNTAVKTRGCLFRVDSILTGGPIGAVRLGMSLDEVVHAWGKPLQAWWNYQGGPRLDYRGVILYFGTSQLTGICINSPELSELRFEPSVPPRSTTVEWQRVLQNGIVNQTRNAVQLRQATNDVRLTLSFRIGKDAPLFQLRLEQCEIHSVGTLLRETRRVGYTDQLARDKFDAAILAKLGALDQGYMLNEHKDPDAANAMQVVRDRKDFWLLCFEQLRPVPGGGLFAWVNQNTGEVEIQSE